MFRLMIIDWLTICLIFIEDCVARPSRYVIPIQTLFHEGWDLEKERYVGPVEAAEPIGDCRSAGITDLPRFVRSTDQRLLARFLGRKKGVS